MSKQTIEDTRSGELPALPFDRPDLLAVAPLLRKLQADCPISRVRTPAGDQAWLVTRYDKVRRLLADDRLGLSHPDPDNAARVNESVFFGGASGNYETEHADRARMRSRLQPYFSPRRMRAFRPRVEALVEELLDRIAARTPPLDLHEALSVPLPILVICELLGVPYEDRARFRAWTQGIADTRDRQRSEAALADLFGYTCELVRRKRAHPDDGVISGLCATEDNDDEVAMLAAILLFAGHETTVVQIDLGVLLMLTGNDQRQALLDDPALLPAAVEEILRGGGTGGGGVPRYAREDIDVGGVTVRAGELLLLDTGAANHDERVFAGPDRFDVTRPPSPHVTFGHGPHYCIGAPLARIELQAVFGRLFQRFPTMRLAVPLERVKVRNDLLTGGLDELPVTW
ncbi:MAG: cytochrome P450 [Streptosporangiales bacterium]|nr:cytochrome P450 [Streptosporangiales bacterium]